MEATGPGNNGDLLTLRESLVWQLWKSSAGSRQTILIKDSATPTPTPDVPKEQGAEEPLMLAQWACFLV